MPLQEVYLDGCNFTGTLPAALGSADLLYTLDLSSNKFTGTIPSEWVGLSNTLVNLSLSNNFLIGTIPESFVDFTLLDVIEVGGATNRFGGYWPFNQTAFTDWYGFDLMKLI